MLQLLPGGQAYLDAAAANVASIQPQGPSSREVGLHKILRRLDAMRQVFIGCLNYKLDAQHEGQTVDGSAAALSGAAVRLVLELQLLAAALVQRQRTARLQQQTEEAVQLQAADKFLLHNNYLLQVHIRAVLQCTSSSCLPPEVLQQAGLQLLQALAAPLQQLQLSSPGERLLDLATSWEKVGDRLNQQLFALRAAAAGLSTVELGSPGMACAAAATLLLPPVC
jgi:hypothetical protein